MCILCILLHTFKKKILKNSTFVFFFFQPNLEDMASQYDEEHFTSVLFPIYSIKSCCESHSKFVLILNLCEFILPFYA